MSWIERAKAKNLCIDGKDHGPVVARRRCQSCLDRQRASDREYQRRKRAGSPRAGSPPVKNPVQPTPVTDANTDGDR